MNLMLQEELARQRELDVRRVLDARIVTTREPRVRRSRALRLRALVAASGRVGSTLRLFAPGKGR